ncbi:uncharacterized protein LOC115623267 [Scaptodrosophila lebanonensis]|uniref:Uncharacterized protein LOC115623267 n=1 Tax=Drosophila lebanonensis TaxID=7225 RepID=A0A6J2TE51_DROLE|nr:uncharacterized protein LOC115623267 [Scaptodrosophila lebanonensis]
MCNLQEAQQSPNKNQNQKDNSAPRQSPTAAYALYLHREELRRRKIHSARTSMTKIQLTNELISKTKQNISICSNEDLQILARETLFKKNLQRHLHYRRMQLQAWMLAKRQAKNPQ